VTDSASASCVIVPSPMHKTDLGSRFPAICSWELAPGFLRVSGTNCRFWMDDLRFTGSGTTFRLHRRASRSTAVAPSFRGASNIFSDPDIRCGSQLIVGGDRCQPPTSCLRAHPKKFRGLKLEWHSAPIEMMGRWQRRRHHRAILCSMTPIMLRLESHKGLRWADQSSHYQKTCSSRPRRLV